MKKVRITFGFLVFIFIVTLVLLKDATINTPAKSEEALFKDFEAFTTPNQLSTPKPAAFKASHLNSSFPLLKDLYPGGFSTLEFSRCDDHINFLVVVHSARNHSNHRQAIRNSWALQLPQGVRVVFIIAEGPTDERINDMYADDVITGNFMDSYKNLTLKSVAMLDWVNQNCPNITFVLKCDDDVFVNLKKLTTELLKVHDRKNIIIGQVASGWKPIRDNSSKYFLSVEEYAPAVLPNFTTGPAYILSGPLVNKLLEVALSEHWLSLEDVFLTGLVGRTRIDAELVHWPKILNRRATLSVCNAHRFFAIHNVAPREQSKLLRLSKMSNMSCIIHEKISSEIKENKIKKVDMLERWKNILSSH